MAFLDNLVSDLIRKSTGFNAKPFVRTIGGKNILLVGGAAIAAAIAAEKMRQPTPNPPGLPTPPVPALPPLPPPPIPIEEAKVSIPGELLFAIVRTMVAGALSDGEIHAEERTLIENRLGESGLTPEQVKQIHKDLVLPPSPNGILQGVSSLEDRELLFRFGCLVVHADSEASAGEKSWLDALAAGAGLSAERRRAIEGEIFEAT